MLFGDAPANHSAVWYPEPDTRGSFGILSSCLITLGLCIWTSVHLNIPGYREDETRRWWDPRGWISSQQWRKTKWLIIGMLAPEMIAFTAFDQWRSARKLSRTIPSLLEKSQVRTSALANSTADADVELNSGRDWTRKRTHKWTIVHSMFVVMGGFAFATHDVPPEEKFLPGKRDRVTPTPEGFTKLAELKPELIPDISMEDIWDKSKANGLAKGIVCVQATWFIANSIFRLSEGLPISLLELNTFAHCLYALLSYAFWWNKPLDVNEPVLITGTSMHGICASLCGFMGADGKPIVGLARYEEPKHTERFRFYPSNLDFLPLGTTLRPLSRSDHAHDQRMILYHGQRIHHAIYYRENGAYECCKIYNHDPEFGVLYNHDPTFGVLQHKGPYIEYDSSDDRRWALSAQAALPIYQEHDAAEPYVRLDRIQNWPRGGSSLAMEDPWFITALILAGLSYGALHLLAWNAPFTTYTQALLWKISGLTVATSGPAFAVLLRTGYWSMDRTDDSSWLVTVFILLILLFWLFYTFARTYLVVECFISFAHLPADIVKQPQWSYYFPHIT